MTSVIMWQESLSIGLEHGVGIGESVNIIAFGSDFYELQSSHRHWTSYVSQPLVVAPFMIVTHAFLSRLDEVRGWKEEGRGFFVCYLLKHYPKNSLDSGRVLRWFLEGQIVWRMKYLSLSIRKWSPSPGIWSPIFRILNPHCFTVTHWPAWQIMSRTQG